MYGLLADLVITLHLLFILFVIFGALLTLRWPVTIWFHLPALCWGAATEFFHIVCPLTPLENHLRQLSGGDSYSGDFILHYLQPVIYPSALTEHLQWLLGTVLVLFNIILYSYLWLTRKKHPEEQDHAH